MTESSITLFEEFTQSLRRNVGERDAALDAIDNAYARGLAAGAADLHPSYLAERESVVNKFTLEAISIERDYSSRATGSSPALPAPPAPTAAYPPPHGETMPAMAGNRQPEVRKRRFSRKAKLIGFVSAGILTLGLIFTGYSIISNNPTIDRDNNPTIDRDAVFLELVHDNFDSPLSDSEVMGTAKAVCAALKEGSTMTDVQKLVADKFKRQSDTFEIASIIGYGVEVYCPELR